MQEFQLGLIEGFYGRSWAQADRLSTLDWLHENGYGAYIYAPKEDASWRADWLQALAVKQQQALQAIADHASASNIAWGVGLSPLGAVERFTEQEQTACQFKLAQLRELRPDILAILFDDMHCTTAALAARQIELTAFIQAELPDTQCIVCPSYYSFDPVLERVFGEMPEHYWQELSAGLSESVSIFWTGNEVCSHSITAADLEKAQALLGRRICLWDNYPVNDGERASQFLHLEAFTERDPALAEQLAAHFVNPMNQCHLSRLAMASLPQVYQQPDKYSSTRARERALEKNVSAALGRAIEDAWRDLTRSGLDQLTENEKQTLLERFAGFSEPAAQEITDWLQGRYAFDPACLTEGL